MKKYTLIALAAAVNIVFVIAALLAFQEANQPPIVIPTIAVLPTLVPTEPDEAQEVAQIPSLDVPRESLQADIEQEIEQTGEQLAAAYGDAAPAATTNDNTTLAGQIERMIVVPEYVTDPVATQIPLADNAAPPTFSLDIPVEPLPNQIIIQFSPDASEEERAAYLGAIGAEITQDIGALDSVVVRVPDSITPDTLPPSPAITETEPNHLVTALYDVQPSDPRFTEQWSLPAIHAPEAWVSLSDDSPTVRVAVIDSGICASHPDLAGRIGDGYDFVQNDATPQDTFGHGCSVSGIIAARMDNAEGIAGVAPNAQIMPLRVLDEQGIGSYFNVAAALVYAADHGAQVINLSLGGSSDSAILRNAVNYALSRGVVIVAAAGNTGREGVLYPAKYDGVIAVASVDNNLQRSAFSSYGSEVDLYAPGRSVLTTSKDGGYTLSTGTSFAAPHAAGAAAVEIALGRALSLGGLLNVGGAATPLTPTDGETDSLPDDMQIIEGDIVVPDNFAELTAQFVYNINLWPDGIVPYQFQAGLTTTQRNQALLAMQMWEDVADVDFVARSGEANYVFIFNGSGNYSSVGMVGGKQDISIASWNEEAVIGHELAHALGVWHEQSRPDRDEYVEIVWSNIWSGYEGNFYKYDFVDTFGEYDFDSIMHYPDWAFANGSSPTIVVLPPNESWQNDIGQRTHYSTLDEQGMAHLYGEPTPGEDSIADAVELGTPYTRTLASVSFATLDGANDPVFACTATQGDDTLWYEFTPQIGGSYTFDTLGSTYDTVLAVWSGNPNSLTSVGCSNNASSTPQSRVVVSLTANVRYFAEVATYAGSPGALELNVSAPPATPNDNIGNAQVIAMADLPFNETVVVTTATSPNGDPTLACPQVGDGFQSVWYQIQPNFNGKLRINTFGSSYDTVIQVWTGTPASLNSVGCNDDTAGGYQSQLTLNVTKNTTYYIEIVGWYEDPSLAELHLSVEDIIFSDAFEASNFSAWSSSVTDGGDLFVRNSAALEGSRLMEALIDSNGAIYVQDESPNNETRYRAGFWFDPNSIPMAAGNVHTIFQAYDSAGAAVTRIDFGYQSNYRLRVGMANDAGTFTYSSWVTISDSPNYLELSWRAGVSGSVELSVNDASVRLLTGIDNSARRITRVRLGAVSGIDTGTRGRERFDAFVSRRRGYIGAAALALGFDEPDTTPTETPELLPTPTIEPTATATETATLEPLLQTVESDAEFVLRSSGWLAQDAQIASGGSYLLNTLPEDTLTLSFTGAALEIGYLSGPSFGQFELDIDGAKQTVDSLAADATTLQRLALAGLSDGNHTVTLRPLSSVVAVDAFYVSAALTPVLPPTATLPPEATEIVLPTELPTDAPEPTDTVVEEETPEATDAATEPTGVIETVVPTDTAEPTEVLPTDTPVPTEIPPTDTPEPTEIPPTDTPEPTETEAPTDAPEPEQQAEAPEEPEQQAQAAPVESTEESD